MVVPRADQPFIFAGDLWRRAGIPSASLVQLAEADAFGPSLGLARREALWAIKALRDEPPPLLADAAVLEIRAVPERLEPVVQLRAMTGGARLSRIVAMSD